MNVFPPLELDYSANREPMQIRETVDTCPKKTATRAPEGNAHYVPTWRAGGQMLFVCRLAKQRLTGIGDWALREDEPRQSYTVRIDKYLKRLKLAHGQVQELLARSTEYPKILARYFCLETGITSASPRRNLKPRRRPTITRTTIKMNILFLASALLLALGVSAKDCRPVCEYIGHTFVDRTCLCCHHPERCQG
ncbi:unnamed protein product [Zymoseptoria tritici ST99CH_3D7]|uniref:Uncharacterized protein n=1 Tax=Zymoseptoria tritici (strain ST99CH_3D7) TaxID=1276538 RepID=A0A1X7RP18_ZYMT9|nr:unnamed protein product [Zymoseptoria tritici ST99CH_3D7]